MVSKRVICQGCGVNLRGKGLSPSDRYNATGECFELFGELSGFSIRQNQAEFIHQLVVDSYVAQHSGGIAKNIGTTFALAGLCLFVEYNYTGRQIQHVHMDIHKQNWERLIPPRHFKMTVKDVFKANSISERELLIKNWAKSVWESWNESHEWIRQEVKQFI